MNSPTLTADAMERAKKLHGQGDYSGASSIYQEILEADPENTEARHFQGIALYQLGQPEKADAMLAETLARQPGNIEWWNNYGNVLTAQNKLKQAEDAFTQVVKLRPDSADAWTNLGAVLQRQTLPAQAEPAYREALRINPRHLISLKLLGALLQQENRTIEGAHFLAQALILESDPAKAPLEIAKAWLILDQPDKAAAVYARLMQEQPEHPSAAFLHAACTGINVPQACSRNYIETIFDAYASNFDQIQTKLAYRGPEMLQEILAQIALPALPLDILDLGCGTGMCAGLLRPRARTLTGVDLSSKMLDRAVERGLYMALVNADLVDYLNVHPASFDLLTSAECFIYFGELQNVFAAMATALRPGGVAVFTIESLVNSKSPYKLHAVGRYCHTQEYVMSLVMQHGFEVLQINPGVLRLELCLPVHGYMWAIRKTVPSSASD